MKAYPSAEIRNVTLAGHAQSGKSTLISAMLHAAHMTPKLGLVEDGTAVTAYDEEDVARGTTMHACVAFTEWNGIKVNLIDTPGFHMFAHEARSAMLPAESALIVVHAANGVEPITERVWKYVEEAAMPHSIVINHMDHARAESSWQETLEGLRARYGRTVVPVQVPWYRDGVFTGIVDLVTMQAFEYESMGGGQGKIVEIPSALADSAKAAHEALVELVAEGKDELMEEFFSVGTLPEQHLITALHEAIREDRIFPVLFSSALTEVAVDHLLDFLKVYAPTPLERQPVAARAKPTVAHVAAGNGQAAAADAIAEAAEGEIVLRRVDNVEPLSFFVFKTMTDPFAGRISFFKVFSGELKNDVTVANYSRGSSEKMAHLSIMQGNSAVPVDVLHAGDLGAVAKLKDTATGDTLGEKGHEVFFEPVSVPEPAMTWAIEPKTRADEDKLAPAVHKLMEEDLLVRFYRDPLTNEFLIAAAGQPHIEALVSKLRKRYHTEVTLKAPKVPYRETIRGSAEAQGRHKKQTGGHGQFGDCKIRIEPLPRGGGFEFVNDIFGGAIPRQFIPAVEKGIQETAARGYLAGFPVVDFKVTLFDGSYHDVDSNEMSFKMAGRLAFRKCMEQAKPVLLEPVMNVEVEIPNDFAGALMGDLNQRRGRVQGQLQKPGGQNMVIQAHVPMAEMLDYGQALTALTQGRGSFHMEMDHYDIVPHSIAEKIIATAKKPSEDDEAA